MCKKPNSTKLTERRRSGVGEKLLIKGPSIKRPANWKMFLSHDENKRHLMKLILQVWNNDSCSTLLQDRHMDIFIS